MKRHNLKLMIIVLCLLMSTVIFPKSSLALTTPSAPTNLTASAVSSTQIYLTWNPVSDATGYYIYRATSPSGNYSIIATPTTSTSSYTDSSLSPGTAFYYKVLAANSLGVSADSVIVYAVTTSSGSTLSAPANLTATVAGSSQIYLTWNSVSYATSYYVYRATSASGTYSVVGMPTTTSYTDTGLSLNTTYYYKVQAVSSGGVSSYSSIAYATTTNSTGGLPSAPTNLAATVSGSNQIYLSWNPVSYATYYYVYRATSPSGPFTSIAVPTTTNYTDSNVPQNTIYYYKVLAVNSAGTSPDSSIVYATTTASNSIPSAPTDVTATVASINQIYLTWDSVSYATYYYVYRSTSPYGTYSIVGVPTTTNYTDSSVTANTTYYYKLQAVGSAGTSSDSAIVNATTTISSSAMSAPTNFTATVISSNQVYLNWYPVSYATYYSVYRSTSLTGTYTIVGVPTTANYTDSTVSANTTYYYKVEAVGNTGSSPDSAIVYATTTTSNGALPAPVNVTATTASSSQIYLSWDPVSSATYYNVYRATSYSGSYSIIGVPTTTSITDSGLSPNIAYYYKVVAVGSTGTSSDSTIVSATTTITNDVMPAPTNVTATAVSNNQIYLTWSPVSNATSYYVYRSTSPSDTYSNIATVTTPYYTDSSLALNTTYYYEIQAVGSSGLSSFSSIVNAATTGSDNTPTSNTSQIPSERLAGVDMYGTSAEVAKEWNTSYYAIIVSGENFSDALCSAPLAQKYNAPLLLTEMDTLNDQTKAQLSRLKVKEVFIVGGVGVISSDVEQTIKNMGIEVTRIAGNDSYETSVKIAQAMGQVNQAVVASGESFSDALSIASIAAMKQMPILLTPKDTLPSSVKTYLKSIQSSYVVGGTGVISDSVFNQLPSPKRLSGTDKYETNISVIKEFANDLDFSTCYISTGENFADALSGSALASVTNSPLFLVSNPVEQSTIDYFGSIMGNIKKEVIFGGTVVVPDSTLTTLNGASDVSNTLSAPIYLTASTVSSSQINLTWDSVSGATSYYIYGATSSTGTYTHIATVTTTSYNNTGLWADTTYYYKVQAVNSTGSGPYSPIAYAKTNS
ncbi:cell wall-binding repeat-containing protein [Desulfosporosinus sp. SB140]|uniref:cell wall-binding repeat-containing protein n=1 Tax=Desulfosporosinus paludis TaxID=3115649 RepID=UPI003890204C